MSGRDDALREMLRKEMPAGTVIGNPDFWAAKIARFLAPTPDAAPASEAREDFVLVPRDPTPEMLVAANAAWFIPDPSPFNKGDEARRAVYAAMLAAAPKPAAETGRAGAWQPIETAPKDGRWIVVGWMREPVCPHGSVINVRWDSTHNDWVDYDGDIGFWQPPTVWTPAPPATPTQDAAHGGRDDG